MHALREGQTHHSPRERTRPYTHNTPPPLDTPGSNAEGESQPTYQPSSIGQPKSQRRQGDTYATSPILHWTTHIPTQAVHVPPPRHPSPLENDIPTQTGSVVIYRGLLRWTTRGPMSNTPPGHPPPATTYYHRRAPFYACLTTSSHVGAGNAKYSIQASRIKRRVVSSASPCSLPFPRR